MKSLITLFALIVFSLSAWAQPSAENAKGKVSGVVLDSTNNSGVSFANVALLDPSTKSPVNGNVCDGDGKFVISEVSHGNYILSISFIGYKTKLIKVTLDKGDLDLGNVILAPSTTTLKEVVVQGQKPLIEEKVDRMVYNAESDATAKGGDATDVLRRVPLLTVDMDGNVSLRGSQNIKVLINGKPSTITASSVSDALKQIPSDQIKTVEVITSPSAKYDAEGSAGIINIILKKDNLEGFSLGINSSAGYRGSNLGLNGSYRKGKVGISLGGFGRANYNTPGDFYNRQKTYSGTDTSTNIQTARTWNNNLFGNYSLGIDYDIDKNNSLTAGVRLGVRNGNNKQNDLTTQSFLNSSEVYSSESIKNIKSVNNSHSVDASLNYTHLFKKQNQEFSFLTLYSQSNGQNNFTTTTNHYKGATPAVGADTLASIINNNPTKNTEATIQADFQTPINDMQMLEVGAKEIMRKATSNASYTDGNGDALTGNSVYNQNQLSYTQNITAGYASYTLNTLSKYSFKVGARYEYTTVSANSIINNNNVPFSQNYGVFVPSLNLSKRFDNGDMIKLSFNRRIQRPSIQNLNPNTVASNVLNVSKGNPDLGPEYTNNYEISYNTHVESTSLNLSAFMRNTNNAIQQIRDTISVEYNGKIQPAIITNYQNIGTQNAYGASLFANVIVSSKFSLSGGGDVYYATLKNNNPIAAYSASNQGWVYNVRMFGNYNIANGWGLQFFGFYRGKQVMLQGYQTGFRIYSLSLQKEFNEKRGSVGLGVENFATPTMKINTYSHSPILDQDGYNKLYYFNFKINFSYRIGKMTTSQPKNKKSINNDDLKDGGGDMNGGGGDMGGGGGQRGGMGSQRGGAPQSQPNLKMAAADHSQEVNAAGAWNYTVDSPQGGNGKIVLDKTSENNYTGTITSNRMKEPTKLKSVDVKGNEITITYEVSFGGNTMNFTINGTIKGDELNGNISVGQFGTFPINAKR